MITVAGAEPWLSLNMTVVDINAVHIYVDE